MRFIKLNSSKTGDLLHVWIEDDCPDFVIRGVRMVLRGASNSKRTGRYDLKVIERRYQKMETIEDKKKD